MEELEYGRDYTEVFSLILIVTFIVTVIFSSWGAFILLPLFFFYMAALQLYSGIGLTLFGWEWSWKHRWIAKYTEEAEASMFYLNVGLCLAMSVFFSLAILAIFLSTRR